MATEQLEWDQIWEARTPYGFTYIIRQVAEGFLIEAADSYGTFTSIDKPNATLEEAMGRCEEHYNIERSLERF